MISVASGPMNSEMTHHQKPDRFLPCAIPELINERVNHPTANPPFVGLICSTNVSYTAVLIATAGS